VKKLRLAFSLMLSISLLVAFVPGAAAGGPSGSWVSGINCVNLSSTQANIQLNFYAQNSAAVSLTFPDTILPNGTKGYYTPVSFPSLASGFVGSAVVSSDQPLACNVNTQTTGTGTAANPYRVGTSAGFTAGAGSMFDPQVMKNVGGTVGNTWNSYMAVQNTGTSATTASVTYQDRAGNAVPAANESFLIQPGSNHIFYQNDNANLPNNFFGAAKVTASGGGTIVVGASFYNDGSSASASQFSSFRGVATGASTILLPRTVRRYYGYNSGVTVQNVGGSPVAAGQLHITFTIGGTPFVVTDPAALAPGAAWALYLPNVPELLGVDAKPMNQRFGGAVVSGPGGSSLIAIVNEDNRGNPADSNGLPIPIERQGQGDTYNGVGLSDATSTVFFPQVPNNAGGVFSGGFNIANATNTAGTCTITYGTTGVVENNVALAGNGSIARFAPNVAGLPNGYNGGVSAHCTQNIVGIANLGVVVGSGKVGDSFTQSTGLNQ